MTNQCWSYQVVEIEPSIWGRIPVEGVQTELTKYGAQGWELVTAAQPGPMAPLRPYFKRAQ